MDEYELVEFIKNNLSINIENSEFYDEGNYVDIKVELLWDNYVVSEETTTVRIKNGN